MNQLKCFISFVTLVTITFAVNVTASNTEPRLVIQKLLVSEANRQGIDPALALAIAEVESNFNPRALSKVGAKGVMQIMPATAENVFGVPAEQLYDEKINIHLGVTFIKQLLTRYNQRLDIALSHYNGGSAVQGKNGQLSVIPATKKYVNKVLSKQQRFKLRAEQLSRNMATETKVARNISPKKESSTPVVLAKSLHSPRSFEGSLYQKVEQLRGLRLHNIMRNTNNKYANDTPLKTSQQQVLAVKLRGQSTFNLGRNVESNTKNRLITETIVRPSKKALPLSEKRKQVLQWEKIFN
jgi:hypothetical protein